ncbi:hypothetical protein ACQEVF_42740 [Nonomuraea polychroma]|uniref:hypothetical protein n=1 Tax=Nonomuraea polychroma TaxID=46176 RepID=UPI003D9075EC
MWGLLGWAPSLWLAGPLVAVAFWAHWLGVWRRARSCCPTICCSPYGRAQCASYPRSPISMGVLAPICPAAAADWRRQDARNQAICHRSGHRPRIRPAVVGHALMTTEIGLQADEDGSRPGRIARPGRPRHVALDSNS